MSLNRVILLCFFSFMLHPILRAEDGYRLWMRYEVIPAGALRDSYIEYLVKIDYENEEISPQLSVAISELDRGVSGLMGGGFGSNVRPILIGTPEKNREIDGLGWESELGPLGWEGYLIREIDGQITIAGNSDQGVLYGVFAFLRHLQMRKPLEGLYLTGSPKIKHRLLNHWDNLTRTIERTMTGASLWNWFDLPYFIEPYYIDYARSCASVGINGTVLTNVNANATVLRPQFLEKVAALADTF